uniref:Membrane integral NOTCH2 associated receptor 2 n=1 Tax=Athene cunicularia TaxID=194338 RepID=A0A663MTW9_ATHCN
VKGLRLHHSNQNMDFSVLPNNNHPDKFLLAKFPEAALPGVQRWHNRVYLQVGKTFAQQRFIVLNKLHVNIIITLNPLYSDIHLDDDWEEKKKTPSWTVQDYDRHSLHSNLASHIKENPNDLQFWMGDIYTPGYDTLLKKKEREKKHSKCCRIILLMVLAVCILITVVTLSVLLT